MSIITVVIIIIIIDIITRPNIIRLASRSMLKADSLLHQLLHSMSFYTIIPK